MYLFISGFDYDWSYKAQYNALSEEEKEIMDVLLQDDTEIPSNLEEDEILDLAKLRFQAFCHQSGRFDMKKDIGTRNRKISYISYNDFLSCSSIFGINCMSHISWFFKR